MHLDCVAPEGFMLFSAVTPFADHFHFEFAGSSFPVSIIIVNRKRTSAYPITHTGHVQDLPPRTEEEEGEFTLEFAICNCRQKASL